MIRTIQRKLKKSRGFTLVELMIVVAIVGILAALAIYGVRKYMANAKSAEAKNSLGQLSKDASTAFVREKMNSAILADTVSTAVSNALCKSASSPVPAAVPVGKKYQSSAAEWEAVDKETGWYCLKFSMAETQYYSYDYKANVAANSVTGGNGDDFTATATGDLDGDTTTSVFTIKGLVRDQRVVVSPTIDELRPEE